MKTYVIQFLILFRNKNHCKEDLAIYALVVAFLLNCRTLAQIKTWWHTTQGKNGTESVVMNQNLHGRFKING